ncbi:MAG: VTT domain-containing protein [Thermoanaerobacteraceae bacterium]|nr:VTT domain-containing protein [Thermoanaerobacteraceae bacterium]
MSFIVTLINFILHIDKYLGNIIQTYGFETYLIIFLIIFMETGFVITPFLPGDSLLFAAGAFAAIGALNIFALFIAVAAAAVIGDTVNYHIGKILGKKIYESDTKLIKKEHLIEARDFYEKYGSLTIVIGRFIPIIRTFVPFVAGVGEMNYFKFLTYNVIGGVTWAALFTFGGYFFGNLDIVKNNFGIIMIAIIVISLVPAVIGVLKKRVA